MPLAIVILSVSSHDCKVVHYNYIVSLNIISVSLGIMQGLHMISLLLQISTHVCLNIYVKNFLM